MGDVDVGTEPELVVVSGAVPGAVGEQHRQPEQQRERRMMPRSTNGGHGLTLGSTVGLLCAVGYQVRSMAAARGATAGGADCSTRRGAHRSKGRVKSRVLLPRLDLRGAISFFRGWLGRRLCILSWSWGTRPHR